MNEDTQPTELMTELLEAGVHFGHQTKRWNPKMKPYIFEKRNAIYIIDLGRNGEAAPGCDGFPDEHRPPPKGKILFVGCKKQAQEAIKEAAFACGQFYVNQRWLGGTLTNLATIRRSIARMKLHRGNRKSPRVQDDGQAGTRRPGPRGCQAQA